MFALKACSDTIPQAAQQKYPSRGGTRIIRKNGLCISVCFDAPYGFCHEFENTLVIGESITPINSQSASLLSQELVNGAHDSRVLGENILLLLCIDFSTKSAIAVSSIACNRPFFYAHNDGELFFSSSIRALSELGLVLSADENNYPEFLVYRYVVPPKTLYKNVNRLIGGQLVRLDILTGNITDNRHFVFRRSNMESSKEQSFAGDRIQQILQDNLCRSFNHYKSPAVLLSGGLDSSLLASISKAKSPNIQSMSSSFSFAAQDDMETEYAVSVADNLGIRHHVHTTNTERYLAGLVESIYIAEEPVHHLQSVMLYLLYRDYAKGQNDILISGEGADGLFGNDLHSLIHKHGGLMTALTKLRISRFIRTIVTKLNIQDYRWRLLSNDNSYHTNSNQHVLWTLGQYSDTATVTKLFGYNLEEILASHRALLQPYADSSILDRTSILSLLCEGAVSMQVWSKLAEGAGVAVQYPFVSPDLVDNIMEISWENKLREPKYYIRHMLRKYGIPENIIKRPKLSFAFPCNYWALPGTLFQPIVDMAEEMFDKATLRSLQTGDINKAMLLWNLINLYIWKKLHIENTSPDALSQEIIERHSRLV